MYVCMHIHIYTYTYIQTAHTYIHEIRPAVRQKRPTKGPTLAYLHPNLAAAPMPLCEKKNKEEKMAMSKSEKSALLHKRTLN